MRALCSLPASLAMAMLAMLLALSLMVTQTAGEERDERSELSSQFAFGSRYGRSEQRNMQPRNDRFLIGNRYGKRATATATATSASRAGRAHTRAHPYGLSSPLSYRLWQGRWVP